MTLRLDDLRLLDAPAPSDSPTGAPLLLPVASIDEDPAQPRQEFDADALRELADTIADRGVRQPISVRRHPEIPGRWLLNFGARRLRASKLAGKRDIPAFVDETADSYDQVIENEQREGLRPLELALFVQRRLAAGDSKAEIARRLGKSQAYVTLATALIDAPDWLLNLYRDGRCRGMTELYELRRLHDREPHRIEALTASGDPITRERVASLRAGQNASDAVRARVEAEPARAAGDRDGACASSAAASLHHPRRHRLEVELEGVVMELVVNRAPDIAGELFVRPLDGDDVRAVCASRLKLLGFVLR